MSRTNVKLLFSLAVIVVLTVGCGLPTRAPEPTQPPAAAPTLPEALSTPTSEATQVVHVMKPTAGGTAVANAHDNEECTNSDQKNVQAGDEFRINRFERPFTANDMEYLPQVDIVGMSMTKDADWYYLQIKLCGKNPTTGELDGIYGAEFDLDIKGKTQVLVLAQGPLPKEWTQTGVTVYADLNGDIGGASSRPDDIYTGNGYETKVFDAGTGEDPDLAWAHANPDSGIVEIAFKQSVLKDYQKWMWNPLASAYPLDPTKFYFNDTISEERAGSPTKGEFYPLKELAGFDNTCRVPANFDAKGNEPMGCQVSTQTDLNFDKGGGYPG